MLNHKTTQSYINQLRDSGDRRDRILASYVECLNNEGKQGFLDLAMTNIGAIWLTLQHSGANDAQIREIFDAILTKLQIIVEINR